MRNSSLVSGFTRKGFSCDFGLPANAGSHEKLGKRECVNGITRLILPAAVRAAPAWGNQTSCNRMQKEKRDR